MMFAENHTAPRTRPGRALARALASILLLLLIANLFSSCGGEDVVLYCALDRNFSEPLIRDFEARTGLKVKAQYDIETTKTVGLVRAIKEQMEVGKIRCDVFWNNEIANTIKLKNLGALQPYKSPSAGDIPEQFKDPEGYWAGLAARARVFIVNTDLLPDKDKWPDSYQDLIAPEWKGKGGIAKPLTGTTATHGAVLFEKLGEEGAKEFFKQICDTDVNLTSGNAHLMRQVRSGAFAFGFTDTDDFNVARVDGHPVAVVYPDGGEGQMGTLVIPNTVAMIKGCPHPDAAKKLIDFILSPEVEERLAHSNSAQIPLHPGVKRPDHVKIPGRDFKAMEVDFEMAAKDFDTCQKYFRELFIK
jgi:iron(III) transport system substrate-binding protein